MGINMSKIIIIMCTYNGEKYIREQIDSILHNTYQDFTLIICDDASTDGTCDIINEYQEQYPERIKLRLNKKNAGVIHNFLSPLLEEKAEYYMFCDQDDVWLPDKIEVTLQLMKKMEKECESVIPITVFSDAKVVDEQLSMQSPSFHRTGKLDVNKVDLAHILMENKLIGCTMMFNQAVAKKVRQIPGNARMHDWWIALITASFGKIVYLDQATLLYRQHEKNVIGNQSFFSYFKNRVTSLNMQKKVIANTIGQAEEFYGLYKHELSVKERKLMKRFISLKHQNGLKKRYYVVKYGFLKSGSIRNIGLLIII